MVVPKLLPFKWYRCPKRTPIDGTVVLNLLPFSRYRCLEVTPILYLSTFVPNLFPLKFTHYFQAIHQDLNRNIGIPRDTSEFTLVSINSQISICFLTLRLMSEA